jgi:predicted dehydrogenase
MSLASALGLARKVRYAVVSLGDIAQEALLPGVAHTGNSEVTAFVTGDPEKARELGKRYGVDHCYGYDDYERLLGSGEIDAVYIASPNWRHAEFAIPALKAGIHVLCEKPLDVSSEKGRAIAEAAAASSAKLMVAYRLHFEPATLDAIRRIRAGELGDLVAFTSCFGQMVDPANHRATNGELAGPLLDMAPYPINATRYLFGEEPLEVAAAVASRHPEFGLGDMDDTVAVTLRFPSNRLAQFTVSYVTNGVDSLIVAGTKGSIHMSPAYGYHASLEQNRIVGSKKTHQSYKHTDQFGGELRYFSDCILHDRDPEPDGEEGLADLRVVDGIREAIRTGRAVTLPPFLRTRRIDPDGQEQRLGAPSAPEPVNASSPSKEG